MAGRRQGIAGLSRSLVLDHARRPIHVTSTAWRYVRIAREWANLSRMIDFESPSIHAALEVLTANDSSSSGGATGSLDSRKLRYDDNTADEGQCRCRRKATTPNP
jgi:hypothetical protein